MGPMVAMVAEEEAGGKRLLIVRVMSRNGRSRRPNTEPIPLAFPSQQILEGGKVDSGLSIQEVRHLIRGVPIRAGTCIYTDSNTSSS